MNEQLVKNANVLIDGNLIKRISTDAVDADDARSSRFVEKREVNYDLIVKDGVIYKDPLS